MDWLDLLAVQGALKSLLQLELSGFSQPWGMDWAAGNSTFLQQSLNDLPVFFLPLESKNAGFQIK